MSTTKRSKGLCLIRIKSEQIVLRLSLCLRICGIKWKEAGKESAGVSVPFCVAVTKYTRWTGCKVMCYLDAVLEDKIHEMDRLWRNALFRRSSGRQRTQHQRLLDFWWGLVDTRCYLVSKEAGEWGEVATLAVCPPPSWGLIQLRETKKYINHLSGPPETLPLWGSSLNMTFTL